MQSNIRQFKSEIHDFVEDHSDDASQSNSITDSANVLHCWRDYFCSKIKDSTRRTDSSFDIIIGPWNNGLAVKPVLDLQSRESRSNPDQGTTKISYSTTLNRRHNMVCGDKISVNHFKVTPIGTFGLRQKLIMFHHIRSSEQNQFIASTLWKLLAPDFSWRRPARISAGHDPRSKASSG
jgi:hypothetical protein